MRCVHYKTLARNRFRSMDDEHTTPSLESSSTSKKPIFHSSAWFSMHRAINILLQHASSVEGLFTIPVPNELAVATWKSISADKGEVQANMRETDLHVLGAGLILHLRELNGSLLTKELHDRFVAAAAISSRYSQIYIFRLLLGELPAKNYAILRDLALLLRSTALKNNSNVTRKIIMSFGRLLLKKRDRKAIVHRQLTALEAGMLFTMVLMEEWTYLFQYGQASFHKPLAEVGRIPSSQSESGLLNNSKLSSSNVDDALHPNESKTSKQKGGPHGSPKSQIGGQRSNSGDSRLSLACAPGSYEPISRTANDVPFHGSLPYIFQLPHVKKASAIGEYLENELNFRHGPLKEIAGLTNSSQVPKDSPTSTPLLPGSKESCDQYGPSTSALTRPSTGFSVGNSSFEDQEVSCDVPSYWNHWFEENDINFFHRGLNLSLAKTRRKEENGLSVPADSPRTSVTSFQKQEDASNQNESVNRITWEDSASSHRRNEDCQDNDRKCEVLTCGNRKPKRSSFIHDGNQRSNFKLGTKQIASMEAKATKSRLKEETSLVNYHRLQSVPFRSADTSSGKDESPQVGPRSGPQLGVVTVNDSSNSSSMKSTKSTLSSLQDEFQVCQSSDANYDLVEDCNPRFWGELPLSGVEHRSEKPLGVNPSIEGSAKAESRSGFANHLDSSSTVDQFTNRPCSEPHKPSSTGGDGGQSYPGFGDDVGIPNLSRVSGENFFPEDNCPTRESNHIRRPRIYEHYPTTVASEKGHGDSSSRTTLVSSNSTFPQTKHRRKSPRAGVEASDEQSTLSPSCLERLQACADNVLRYKISKGLMSRPVHQSHFEDEGGKGLATVLNDGFPSEDELGHQSSEDRQHTAKAMGALSSFDKNPQDKKDAREFETGSQRSHNPSQVSDRAREVATRPALQKPEKEFGKESNLAEKHEGTQTLLRSSDFYRSQVSPRSVRWSSTPRFSVNTKGRYLEDASSMNDCNNPAESSVSREEACNGDQCATSTSSFYVATEHCETVDFQSCEDLSPVPTNEGMMFASPHLERVCDTICSSFTQSKKSIEEVLGACADVVVTTLLPIISLDQEFSLDTEGSCECRDAPANDAIAVSSGPSLYPPCIPPGQTPGRPLPCPAPRPRPPPPPPPPPPPRPPRSIATSILPTQPLSPSKPLTAMPLTSASAKTPPPPPPPPPQKARPCPPSAPPPPSKNSAPPPPQPPPLKAQPCPPSAPPPPSKNSAPPPPPPPGGRNNVEARRPKMKQLVWDKITGSMAECTIWKTATPGQIKMDLAELEALFAVKEAASQHKSPTKVASIRKKKHGMQVLDLKRAHNIGIQLRSLRKPIPDLCDALQEKNETMLTMEVLNVLLNTLPNEEDIALLRSYQGDLSELAEVEMYYVELLKIPRYEKLIKSFIFKGQYNLTFQQIEQELKLLEQACNQLKGSQSFKKILEMVLAVGNHLNGDSFCGAARGFKLGALLKLMDIKSHNKKITLLHFVVAELMRKDEKVLKLTEESKAVKAAANLSLDRLQSGLRELENGLDLIKAEITLVKEGIQDDQQLLITMMPFYEKVNVEVISLRDLHHKTLANLKDLATYFGETLKQERLIDVFKTMREFFFMFDQVTLELREAKHREFETAKKKSQSSASYSCPASPAHKAGQRTPESLSSVEISKGVLLDSKKRSPVHKTSHHIGSSLLGEGNSASFQQHTGISFVNEHDRESVSFPCLVVDQKHERSGGNDSCSTVATAYLQDKFTDRLDDPLDSQTTCYDSDWSTG